MCANALRHERPLRHMTPERFADIADVSPERLADYQYWVNLLIKWNQRINLVSPSAMSDVWFRHVLDSHQIWSHVPKIAMTLVDFGSGAGFPGLSLGIEAKWAKNGQSVHLIESVGKKANFLKTVSRETSLPCTIWANRIEAVDSLKADIITARAFAPLSRLLPLAAPHLNPRGHLILLKGQDVEREINAVSPDWSFDIETHPSRTDEQGIILILKNLKARS